jgi:hypothetical protein
MRIFWALLVAATITTPAIAGTCSAVGAPGPIAGIGVAAVAALGFGYRAIKRRIDH